MPNSAIDLAGASASANSEPPSAPSSVTVRISSGLGNQLFQFAAGLALARHRDCGLVLDTSHYGGSAKRQYQLDRFNLPGEVVTHRGRAKGDVPVYREPHFYFSKTFFDLVPPVRLVGYFLSELYFARVAEEIRRIYTPRFPLSAAAEGSLRRIAAARHPVSLHIRRGDYASTAVPHLDPLPVDYYRQATSLLGEMIGEEPTYFVFSDDVAEAAEMTSFLPDRILVEGDVEDPWESLIVMRQCRHHVIANSTFSWWGAWLSEAADRAVIAPRRWHTDAAAQSKDTRDLIPDGWRLV
ncbi:MAG: alpha-1,2-fucosyltransferase [Bauldia sp.]|nr:alpha-1,2-fucosyltransferase [Bauldia sp.]